MMRLGPLKVFYTAALLLALADAPARGGSIAAVLSEESGPYAETFAAFVQEYGITVPAYDLSTYREIPRERVVAAFGGKAAILDYPGAEKLIYCLAPGIKRHPNRKGQTISVSMVPTPRQVLETILLIQPGIRRLAVFYSAENSSDYVETLQAAAKLVKVEIVQAKVGGAADIPGELRRLYGGIDAFWLLPDPSLVSKETFLILRDFSRMNRLPFYAPTAGLAQRGATAAVYNSFKEIGRTVAAAAKEETGGVSSMLYPEKVSYSINTAEAGLIGLQVPAKVLDGAEALFK